jgi:hypothetical protein
MATKKAAKKVVSKLKVDPAAQAQPGQVEKQAEPELELFYRVLTGFLFNHQVFQMGSVQHFSQVDAELLQARGVITVTQEVK